jgi:glucose/arabinose dehydrogenase
MLCAIGLLGWTRAARLNAAETSAVMQIRSINPLLSTTEVDARTLSAKQWTTDDRGRKLWQPIPIERVVAIGTTYFVGEQGTGRWFVGQRVDDQLRRTSEIQCRLSFNSLGELLEHAKFAELPTPPQGFKVREVARFPHRPVQVISHPNGQSLYVLFENGDVWSINPSSGQRTEVIRNADYIDRAWGEVVIRGMALDQRNRLYLAINQRALGGLPISNNVTIVRTIREVNGHPAGPAPWFRTSYPWGQEPFHFGIGPIAFGPDGMLYVSSGARTDSGEAGVDSRYWRGGEHELTGSIWRLDPNNPSPTADVYVRGLRYSRGFCWDRAGNMLATDIGSDQQGTAELNLLKSGQHYGFPFRFSNSNEKPFPHTPADPVGARFALPLANLGPDGGYVGEPLYTFDPYSNPSALVTTNDRMPHSFRGGVLVARFGNEQPLAKDVGFDILFARLVPSGDTFTLETHQFLTGVSRPNSMLATSDGRVFVCEYSRANKFDEFATMLPGRLIELTPK